MGSAANGLTEELLSPDLTDSFEVIHSTFAAYSGLEAPVMRETQEVGFVISGRLNLKIAERSFTVCPGAHDIAAFFGCHCRFAKKQRDRHVQDLGHASQI